MKIFTKKIENCSQCSNAEVWSKSDFYLYVCRRTDKIIGRVGGVVGVTSVVQLEIPEWCPLEDSV